MEFLYALTDTLLPFQWLGHGFMKHAFFAVLLVAPLLGLLGTMVVSNRMAFFSDSLGHGAFTGIAIGVLLGKSQPLLSIAAFSVLFALLITYIKHRSSASTDTIIGVFSSTAIAAGLMMMSYGGNFSKFSQFLIGDILSITPREIELLGIVFAVTVALWMFMFNRLLIVSINPSFASSRGIRSMQVEMMFAAILAVVVAMSLQWVGILIINSMLVLPAAAARNVANTVKQYHVASVAFALFSGVAGLCVSYYANTAAGATIVMISSIVFFITLLFKSRMVR